LGNDKAKQEALEGIQSAASFLRRELRDRINMKHTPFLSYHLDGSIEEADQLFRVMNQIKPGKSTGETSDLKSSPRTSTENPFETASGSTNISGGG
jgi:ribosome-binding factor A